MKLFGFEIKLSKQGEVEKNLPSVVTKEEESGDIHVGADYNGYVAHSLNLEGQILSENLLIDEYRELAKFPEVGFAINEIVNEAIILGENKPPVSLNLDNLELSDKIKESIRDSFNEILNILSFNLKGQDIFETWYVDGRYNAHIVVDSKHIKDGIKDIRYIDPKKIKKFKEIKFDLSDNNLLPVVDKEYFIFNPTGIDNLTNKGAASNAGVIMTADSVVHVNSGLYDRSKGIILSHLDDSKIAANNLKMMESSLVIYRLSRAPERRIFYIDIGNLPKGRAETYMSQIMNKYKNKLVYDASTGSLKDESKHMSMIEDFWIPRREGSRGTEIDTLQGAQHLGDIEDVEYFREKLKKTLKIPISRMDSEGSQLFGRASEINRDEVRFSKFISKLRARFSLFFEDLLKKQLILKGIMSEDEWFQYKSDIFFDYLRDNLYTELFETELLTARLELLDNINDHVGVYFSREQVSRDILRMTDEEIKERDKQIEQEKPLKNEEDEF